MAEQEQFVGSELLLQQSDTIAYLEEQELGSGVLSISEDAVQWSCAETARDISLSFPHIAIHAISRDTTVFPFKPCIFLLYSLPDVDDPEQEEVTHYRLAPPQSNQLEEIFEAISECQQLYPDSDLSSDSDLPHEGDGGGDLLQEEGYFTTAEGLQHLSAEGESVLAHLEDILHIQEQSGQNGSQFDDAA